MEKLSCGCASVLSGKSSFRFHSVDRHTNECERCHSCQMQLFGLLQTCGHSRRSSPLWWSWWMLASCAYLRNPRVPYYSQRYSNGFYKKSLLIFFVFKEVRSQFSQALVTSTPASLVQTSVNLIPTVRDITTCCSFHSCRGYFQTNRLFR